MRTFLKLFQFTDLQESLSSIIELRFNIFSLSFKLKKIKNLNCYSKKSFLFLIKNIKKYVFWKNYFWIPFVIKKVKELEQKIFSILIPFKIGRGLMIGCLYSLYPNCP